MGKASSLRKDAIEIWQAGVAAVDSTRLVTSKIQCQGNSLSICGHHWCSEKGGRICVVGAGKAGAGMAQAVEGTLTPELLEITTGWVNVPDDCVRQLKTIHLHGGRPAGMNEPTQAGVEGTNHILQQVQSLNEHDLCIVLISGGGSALLPAPIEGITLEQKQLVTRLLMNGGATIEELNCVRRALSSVKGGGLLRACKARTLITLIISDVIGNPLETIASGPTVASTPDAEAALKVLDMIADRTGVGFPEVVIQTLQERASQAPDPLLQMTGSQVLNMIIGDNSTAVRAACDAAIQLGYEVHFSEHDQAGIAREIGKQLAQKCLQLKKMKPSGKRLCIITGGEPTVHLTKTDQPQKGGRNQELVLAATHHLWDAESTGIAILSGGTDGEDGPTDAAGALIDAELIRQAKSMSLNPEEYLLLNNSYPFFESIEGLLKTGPTHTNVMDLRVALIET